MVSWYSCSLVLKRDSVWSMRLPRLPSWESWERAQAGTSEITYTSSSMSLKTRHWAKDPVRSHQCRQDSLDRLHQRCHHWSRGSRTLLQQWCTACCSLWSPPTAAGSPHSPMSGCHNRRRFRMSHACQHRSYLRHLCVGHQEERREKMEGKDE